MELQCARQLQGSQLHRSPGPQRGLVSLFRNPGAMAQATMYRMCPALSPT
ncbi:hypothetical protein Cadr_000000820 [Camelus dromedarius]|uniref:Uncharacterized protein n=1 Tax=Camelus dromedarius TaxID=9838 RepID=A0A5N4EK85_CAMDR|nr:hypothetical protein Cadr_000000820 [Camelus dromedarius]